MQIIHLLLQDEELHEVSVDENGAISDVLNNNEFQVDSQTVLSKPIGKENAIANISEGVIFIRGFFVKVPAQELILEKYSGKSSFI